MSKKLTKTELKLKDKILQSLKNQGFKINPHLKLPQESKFVYKKIQKTARLDQIRLHKKFLTGFLDHAKEYCKNGDEINPEDITLELREIKSESFDEKLFRWWNFIWWSIPYQRAYGRQMRFFLWDTAHDLPFGLIHLQSPILRLSSRDDYLGIPKNTLDYWVNLSMNAQRVGALPPYNDLIGGKMVALTLASNEIRKAYKKKYQNKITLIQKRKFRF